MVITPSHVHRQVEVLFSAGIPPMSVVGDPTIQGAVVSGMQGIGVSTPAAAAVAVITVGLVGAIHIPNDMMLAMGK